MLNYAENQPIELNVYLASPIRLHEKIHVIKIHGICFESANVKIRHNRIKGKLKRIDSQEYQRTLN